MPISLGGLLHGWMTMAMANESQEQARRMRRHPTWDDKPLLAKVSETSMAPQSDRRSPGQPKRKRTAMRAGRLAKSNTRSGQITVNDFRILRSRRS
jgi:hypothetical protein